jgi:hypothetical protein
MGPGLTFEDKRGFEEAKESLPLVAFIAFAKSFFRSSVSTNPP